MKEITAEVKRAIFGLYINQEIACHNDINLDSTFVHHVLDEQCIERYYLRLKMLSSISDEDAIKVSKLILSFTGELNDFIYFLVKDISDGDKSIRFTGDYEHGNIIIQSDCKIQYNKGIEPMPQSCADYLRSKGYSVGYLDYSVEDLVQAGIFKLTEK